MNELKRQCSLRQLSKTTKDISISLPFPVLPSASLLISLDLPSTYTSDVIRLQVLSVPQITASNALLVQCIIVPSTIRQYTALLPAIKYVLPIVYGPTRGM